MNQRTFEARIFAEVSCEKQREKVPQGFPPLPEIPGGRYHRQDFFDLEVEYVFRKSWVMAGHVSELREPGSYKRFDKLLGSPIILVRDRVGEIRAFYNTCRHRGAPVVKDSAGRCNTLRCQYHSWCYDLDGQLLQVPDEHDFINFNKSERGLLPVRCEVYRGLIFINEDPDAISLLAFMGPLDEEWSHPGLDEVRVSYYRSRVLDCNWKCAFDAFQEVYHISTLHPESVGRRLDRQATTVGLMPRGHSRMCVGLADAGLESMPPEGWPEGEMYRRISVAHTLWPALIRPRFTHTARFLLFWPLSATQCEIEVIGVRPDWGDGPAPNDQIVSDEEFDKTLEEDVKNLASIQASLNSGAFTGMLLNYQERRIYWAHEEIDRAIGFERVPAELRVEQVLAPFVEDQTEAT